MLQKLRGTREQDSSTKKSKKAKQQQKKRASDSWARTLERLDQQPCTYRAEAMTVAQFLARVRQDVPRNHVLGASPRMYDAGAVARRSVIRLAAWLPRVVACLVGAVGWKMMMLGNA